MRYHAILPQAIRFRFDQKLKNHEVAPTLGMFKPSAARLQYPWLRSATNLVYFQNAIVSFLHAQSHSLSPAYLDTIEQ